MATHATTLPTLTAMQNLYYQHPQYGRIYTYEGWINNNPCNNCTYCGAPIVTKGFCQKHLDMLHDNRVELDKIIAFRNNEKSK